MHFLTKCPWQCLPHWPCLLTCERGQTHHASPSQAGRAWLGAQEKLLRASGLGWSRVHILFLLVFPRACSAQTSSKVLVRGLERPLCPSNATARPHPCPQGAASLVYSGSLSFLSGQPGLDRGASQSVISVRFCPMTTMPWKHLPPFPSFPWRHLKATSRVTFLLLGAESFPHWPWLGPALCLPSSLSPRSLPLSGREAGLSPGPTID